MGKRWPPIKRRDWVEILENLGLMPRAARKSGRGDHRVYHGQINGRSVMIPVDWNVEEVDYYYVGQLEDQSGLTKAEIYGRCKRTARSASVPCLLKAEPEPTDG